MTWRPANAQVRPWRRAGRVEAVAVCGWLAVLAALAYLWMAFL
jgi:hypothetical protein